MVLVNANLSWMRENVEDPTAGVRRPTLANKIVYRENMIEK